jgi:Flp pilus assembly protein TadG
MTARRSRSFIASEDAGATVEFVALMPAFLLLTFFIAEVLIAVLWIGTAEKAAQLGARLAVVSNYAVTTLSATTVNAAKNPSTDPPGKNCDTGCSAFASQTCDGSSMAAPCDTTNFTAIVSRMQNIATLIEAQYVTITYAYTGNADGTDGLGFAGGPIVPSVTVKLHGIPYNTVATAILANFFKKATGNNSATSPLTTLPDISVTLTGEDLSSAGAS